MKEKTPKFNITNIMKAVKSLQKRGFKITHGVFLKTLNEKDYKYECCPMMAFYFYYHPEIEPGKYKVGQVYRFVGGEKIAWAFMHGFDVHKPVYSSDNRKYVNLGIKIHNKLNKTNIEEV